MAEAILSIRGLTKSFGELPVVDGLDLDVQAGEMIAFLGPSGCGKTTTLRMISGLTRPSAGDITFDGRTYVCVSRRIWLPPEKRNLGMVFQSYALWPHMTVAENVGYPLKLRGVKGEELRRRVLEVLALMGLERLVDQTVPRLSGGQQQRVALARALVYRPSLMLFDEPFSNLDAALRAQMRMELKSLWKKVQVTGIFVTHDQLEALSLADRVAIMNRGRIEQIGAPREVYSNPRTRFVRDFLGKAVNLHGTLSREGTGARVSLGGAGSVAVPVAKLNGMRDGERVELSVRPEHVELVRSGEAVENVVRGTIDELLFTGERYETRVRVAGEAIQLDLPTGEQWREGQELRLRLREDAMTLWGGQASDERAAP